ncbi:MAG: hypothetical protein KF745_09090 [Phycisphaeraceae bacterium]|nr:hypothetical protein [Phycisphaeraceae bacterium]
MPHDPPCPARRPPPRWPIPVMLSLGISLLTIMAFAALQARVVEHAALNSEQLEQGTTLPSPSWIGARVQRLAPVVGSSYGRRPKFPSADLRDHLARHFVCIEPACGRMWQPHDPTKTVWIYRPRAGELDTLGVPLLAGAAGAWVGLWTSRRLRPSRARPATLVAFLAALLFGAVGWYLSFDRSLATMLDPSAIAPSPWLAFILGLLSVLSGLGVVLLVVRVFRRAPRVRTHCPACRHPLAAPSHPGAAVICFECGLDPAAWPSLPRRLVATAVAGLGLWWIRIWLWTLAGVVAAAAIWSAMHDRGYWPKTLPTLTRHWEAFRAWTLWDAATSSQVRQWPGVPSMSILIWPEQLCVLAAGESPPSVATPREVRVITGACPRTSDPTVPGNWTFQPLIISAARKTISVSPGAPITIWLQDNPTHTWSHEGPLELVLLNDLPGSGPLAAHIAQLLDSEPAEQPPSPAAPASP